MPATMTPSCVWHWQVLKNFPIYFLFMEHRWFPIWVNPDRSKQLMTISKNICRIVWKRSMINIRKPSIRLWRMEKRMELPAHRAWMQKKSWSSVRTGWTIWGFRHRPIWTSLKLSSRRLQKTTQMETAKMIRMDSPIPEMIFTIPDGFLIRSTCSLRIPGNSFRAYGRKMKMEICSMAPSTRKIKKHWPVWPNGIKMAGFSRKLQQRVRGMPWHSLPKEKQVSLLEDRGQLTLLQMLLLLIQMRL